MPEKKDNQNKIEKKLTPPRISDPKLNQKVDFEEHFSNKKTVSIKFRR